MTLVLIRDYLKAVLDHEGEWFGTAKMDGNLEKAFCLYLRPKGVINNIAVGGVDATGYGFEALSLLIRWGRNPADAEQKARQVRQALDWLAFDLDGIKCFVQCVFGSPIPLGTDEKGVFEYSLDFNLFYER